RRAGRTKPILAVVMGDGGRPLRLDGEGERIPANRFPENAVRALGKIATYADWRSEPPGLYWDFDDIHDDDARTACRTVIEARDGDWLTTEETRTVLGAFGLPLVPVTIAKSATEAAALASVIGFPVVAKLVAPALVHKSDIGGVRMHLEDERAVRRAFDELIDCARQHGFGETLEGVLIQPMIKGGVETIVGVVRDPVFGSLIGFGLG